MKQLSEIAWNVDEPTYRADPALSYSTLSSYERNGRFSSLETLGEQISTPSLTFGSMVDTLITDSEEEFQNKFIVVDDPGISDNLKEITSRLFSMYGQTRMRFEDIQDDVLARIGKECDYYANDKYASYRVKLIKENCKPYYNTLCIAEGKTVVTNSDVEDVRRCVEALKTNKFTAFYFDNNDPFDTAINRFYQLKFKGTHDGVAYRCMADLIVVNNEKKTIQPCDLKTSSHNEWEFPKSFQQWRYDLQARLYWRLINANVKADPFFKDYKVLPYKFIVVNRKNCKPMVWDFPMTEALGQLEIITPTGYHITWRDPYDIGKELKRYLNENPEYPFGTKESQDIVNWLRTN